ncbi:AAA family ATPase [Pseudoalteromonas phenolica]|uniref:AAA family ATPase n=1 Tax=Pseudoalteromonas phenolica TaxID=161398 RepID=UPI00110C075D|nr:ATP-binding protein [Pseudoalteromonas phenolica]TMO53095.1 abortive infection protein [Pseudoalteromonas phenolica]
MIKNYTFKNFQSYLNECHVDFTVNKKAAHSYFDYQLENGSKVARVMAVLGANGAGKSNLLKPLAFLSWFIPHSFGSIEKNERIPFIPYALNDNENTFIELEFVIPKWEDNKDEFEYKYSIELNEKRVVKESLKVKTSRLYSNVISREYDDSRKKYKIKNSDKYGSDLATTILERAPENTSIISYVLNMVPEEELWKENGNEFILLASGYFESNKTNLVEIGKHNLSDNIEEATEFYLENPEYFEKVKSLLMKYDLGIADITLEPRILTDSRTGKEIEKTLPVFRHDSNGRFFKIPIFLESSGTQSAYCVLSAITETLAKGGVAILDEFDNDLHPLLTMEIVNLFKDDLVNLNNAQLLFNTHTVDVLKNLRMQHCYLVEKVDGVSDAYRADQVDGLLARDNLYAKYISGALGAVPEFE